MVHVKIVGLNIYILLYKNKFESFFFLDFTENALRLLIANTYAQNTPPPNSKYYVT